MVELFEQDIKNSDVQSSKGNQLKWRNGGIWYKADYMGYEGLAEYVTSHLLEKSSLRPEELVLYDTEQIKYRNRVYNGARSADFLQEGWQLITLERLFKNVHNQSLNAALWRIHDVRERIMFLEEQVKRITGLEDFGTYINKLFTVDAFFLNEDRHTHNIAVLMDGEENFRYCPIFDQGAALLSDVTMDYPLDDDVYNLMINVHPKTLCTDFDEQLDISELLYGENLHFCFNKNDVRSLLDAADGYSAQIRQRVERIVCSQIDKYSYLFK